MHTRLLSFLSDIETALAADDPAPVEDGCWDNSRTVNYHLGLARLNLNVRVPAQPLQPRGSILLQCYSLADGTPCLKAAMSWNGREESSVRAIYTKPGLDWKSEARKVAAEWMGGPPALPVAPEAESGIPAAAEPAAAIAG